MKSFIAILLLALATSAQAANTSANQGHHGGPSGNHGALGSSMGMGAAQGSSSANAGSSASGGNGGTYGDWYLRSSSVDNYQPYPESEMAQFQKPEFTPYAGE